MQLTIEEHEIILHALGVAAGTMSKAFPDASMELMELAQRLINADSYTFTQPRETASESAAERRQRSTSE